MKAYLGIDTSNYTTSACLMSEHGFVSKKIPLSVKLGEKGVRQSEAVFQHTKNMPTLFQELFREGEEYFGGKVEVCAIGVSDKPRNVEGSYMPCFLSGVASASSVACATGTPLHTFSHQEGHIKAAILGSGMDSSLSNFYSFHLSGGTCELLKVEYRDNRINAEIIADSADITLGQLIDRTGVMLGLGFPCGKELEALASTAPKIPVTKIKTSKHINLSGFENKTVKMKNDGLANEDIAAFVFGACIGAVEALLENREDKNLPVLFSGGVSSSYILKNHLEKCCEAYFAPPMFSADNAIGIAALAMERTK